VASSLICTRRTAIGRGRHIVSPCDTLLLNDTHTHTHTHVDCAVEVDGSIVLVIDKWVGECTVQTQTHTHTHAHTHTHTFNGLFTRTTWVSRHQKGKPFWILLKQEMMGWQWHQLDHMQNICTTLQTDNHSRTSSLNFYGLVALPDTQPTVLLNKWIIIIGRVVWYLLIEAHGDVNIQRRTSVVNPHSRHLP